MLRTIAICTLTVSLAATAAAQNAPGTTPDATNPPAAETVSLDDLDAHLADYAGQRVTVNAEVDRVLGPRVVAIEDGGWLGGSEAVVLADQASVLPLAEGERVTVTGTVRTYADVREGIEAEWSWMSPAGRDAGDLARRPVLVAESVVAGGRERLVPATAQAESNPPAGATVVSDFATVADARGADLVGRVVRITAPVFATAGRGYWLGETSRRLYVRPATPHAFSPGDVVTIDGVVLRLPEDIRTWIGDVQGEHLYVWGRRLQVRSKK
jgi:hypothetical protein